jgi:hypothetical protein
VKELARASHQEIEYPERTSCGKASSAAFLGTKPFGELLQGQRSRQIWMCSLGVV